MNRKQTKFLIVYCVNISMIHTRLFIQFRAKIAKIFHKSIVKMLRYDLKNNKYNQKRKRFSIFFFRKKKVKQN